MHALPFLAAAGSLVKGVGGLVAGEKNRDAAYEQSREEQSAAAAQIRQNGVSSAGLRQRVLKVTARLLGSLGIKLSVPGGHKAEEMILRSDGQRQDEAIPLYTGDADALAEAEYDRDGRATWTSEDPLPATITLGVLNIDVSWRDE